MNETASERERLKPCPFCGAGQTMLKENGKQWLGMRYSEPSSVSVQHWCDPVTGQPSRMVERVGRDEASAIAAWNRRAALPAPADQHPGPQGSSGSLSESGVEVGTRVTASASVSGYGALAAMDLLRRIEPHIDAIVCYASTCDEHEPNLIAKDLRTLLHSYPYVPAFAWQPIETAQWQERALLYAPPENLYEKPQGRPGEFRVTRRADWTWATHWMPLPQPPSADAAVVPAQHGASDNSEQDQPKGLGKDHP